MDKPHPSWLKGKVGDEPEKPFPLEQRFRRQVLPIIGLFVVSLIVLTALAVIQTLRDVQLEFAARRVQEISREMTQKAPMEWSAVIAAKADFRQWQIVADLLREAADERGLPRLKLYSSSRVVMFSTVPGEVGVSEDNTALAAAIGERERVLLPHRETDGSRYNEYYIPLQNDKQVALVFELYEPAGYLNAIIARALLWPTLVPGLLLVGLVVTLGYLIRRAQAGIDVRAARVRELSARVESLISSSAVEAARAAPTGSDMPLRRIEVSLLYSDVRHFTGYAEAILPEKVVDFLSRIMALQIDCVSRHAGDVDKLIGDALLARFEGTQKERRAIAAALDIQSVMQRSKLPRGVGIGVFTGTAILGPIGPKSRRDYTVIGDSVNIAARLCAKAQRGEIVCDVATVKRSGLTKGPVTTETIEVKGRKNPIEVCRLEHSGP
jgi:adenylate cyclase